EFKDKSDFFSGIYFDAVIEPLKKALNDLKQAGAKPDYVKLYIEIDQHLRRIAKKYWYTGANELIKSKFDMCMKFFKALPDNKYTLTAHMYIYPYNEHYTIQENSTLKEIVDRYVASTFEWDKETVLAFYTTIASIYFPIKSIAIGLTEYQCKDLLEF